MGYQNYHEEGLPTHNQQTVHTPYVESSYTVGEDGKERSAAAWKPKTFDRQQGVFVNNPLPLGLLRKIYSALSIQLLVTFGFVIATACDGEMNTFNGGLENFFGSKGICYGCLFGVIVLFIAGFCCCRSTFRRAPASYVFITSFTLLWTYILAHICINVEVSLVVSAVGTTMFVFMALTLFTFLVRPDCSKWGFYLFAASMAVLALFLFEMLMLSTPLGSNMSWEGKIVMMKVVSWVMVVLLSVYIVYDTWKIIERLDPRDWVFGAIELYLDIINLFMEILRLMSLNKK